VTAWTDDELSRVGAADELEVAPVGPDGNPRRPVPVWVVRVGDDLYLRSWRGLTAPGFAPPGPAARGA
jgi:hypothetical protein